MEWMSLKVPIGSGACVWGLIGVVAGGIKACGGKCLARIPAGALKHAYVISTKENCTKHNKVLQKHPHFQAIEAEAVFDAILRQEIRFSRHIIS